jgi:hypothetical protein
MCANFIGAHSHASLRHVLPALVAYLRYDASQSPYPGCQNIENIRQAMILSIPYWDLLLYFITG